jgi:hypothetical protein
MVVQDACIFIVKNLFKKADLTEETVAGVVTLFCAATNNSGRCFT